MKIKQTYKYMCLDLKNTVINYYIAIVGIYLVTLLLQVITSARSFTSINTDGVTIIFLFIVGLCSFKENYLILAQNGVSRRTMFISRMLTAATVAIVTLAADQLLMILARLIARNMNNLHINSFMTPIGTNTVTYLFIMLAGYFFAFVVGYFITVLFYRLNKVGKVLVAAGVPIGLNLLGILDSLVFNSKIAMGVAKFFVWASGAVSGQVYRMGLTLLVAAVIFGAFGWLLTRRAVVKE